MPDARQAAAVPCKSNTSSCFPVLRKAFLIIRNPDYEAGMLPVSGVALPPQSGIGAQIQRQTPGGGVPAAGPAGAAAAFQVC